MALFALGSNGSGQLGIGHLEDVSVPTRHELSLTGEPHAIRAGGNHTLIQTKDGEIYLSGAAFETKSSEISPIKRVTAQTSLFSQNVQACSATWEASVLVSAQHELYTYGKGERGELGRDTGASEKLDIPRLQDSRSQPLRIVDVASGVQHTVVVFEDGQVWGWGNGRKGQLGEPAGFVLEPRKIQDLTFKVARVVCGREFTFLAGDPKDGPCTILGSDKWGVASKAPSGIADWRDIGACWGSIHVLFQSGSVVSWGRDDHGQLSPKNLPPIRKLACGSEHCLALTQNGKVLAWGWGEHGNCGPSTDQAGDVKGGWAELQVPNSSPDTPIVGIGAGCATSWIWIAKEKG